MSENNKGQSRRRRRRRRSGKNNSGSRNNSGSKKKSNRQSNRGSRKRSGGKRSGGKRSGRNSGNRKSNRGSSRGRNKLNKFGGREPVAEFEKRSGPLPLTPFELFCAYYMGVTDDNRYRKPSMGDTARRFNIDPEDVEMALRSCGMDKHTIRDVDYDMSLAQLDVRVAPEGVDKREIARNLFDEFIEVNEHFVDLTAEQIAADIDVSLSE